MMLKELAQLALALKKYSYYPIFIGIIGVLSAWAYKGTFRGWLGIGIAAACSLMIILVLLCDTLCKKAGISNKIR